MKSFYVDGDYDLVLKHLKQPFTQKRNDEILANVIRLCSLKKTKQPTWKMEYEFLKQESMLEVFNKDTQSYLNQYFRQTLFDEDSVSIGNGINTSKIPDFILKCFQV